MDRVAVVNRLLDASQHVAGGSTCIVKQQALIERLHQNGHSTDSAEALLQTFEMLQALQVEHRGHLANRLRLITTFDEAPKPIW